MRLLLPLVVVDEFALSRRSSGWTTCALVVLGMPAEVVRRFMRVEGVAGADEELDTDPRLAFEAFRDGGGMTMSGRPESSLCEDDDLRVGGLGLIMGDTLDTREEARTGVVDLFPRRREVPATFELLLLAAVDGSC